MLHLGPLIGKSFLVLTILLFLSISIVIWRLKVKQRRIKHAGSFGKEIKNLLIILVLFSFSFLTRYILDTFVSVKVLGSSLESICVDDEGVEIYCYPYDLIIWLVGTQYIFDLIPITAILLFHHYNFKEAKENTAKM